MIHTVLKGCEDESKTNRSAAVFVCAISVQNTCTDGFGLIVHPFTLNLLHQTFHVCDYLLSAHCVKGLEDRIKNNWSGAVFVYTISVQFYESLVRLPCE